MNIEDIVNLTDGVLQNSPSVQAIESATVFSSKVERGDLFFSSSDEETQKALDNGAYAIVYEKSSVVQTDNEVAWIKVENLELAAYKLLRYVVIKNEAKFFLLTTHELSFLKMLLVHKKSVCFLHNDWKKAFEQILNGSHALFIGSNKNLLTMLHSDVSTLQKSMDGYKITDTLFKTAFRIDGYVYQDKELAPFHLDALFKVLAFCKNNALEYTIDALKYTPHYQPYFINNNLQVIHKSKSDKVVIFVDNLKDIDEAMEYIRYSNSWVKTIVLTPPKTKVDGIDRPYWYEDATQMSDIIKSEFFNYAFVYGANKEMLQSIKVEYSLFD